MDFKFSKAMLSAATAGMMLGAVAACGGNAPAAESPSSMTDAAPSGAQAPAEGDANATEGDAAAAAADAKACCKAMNECKGKGGCKTETNECAGKNECKGKGGCNAHCPQ